MSAVRSLALLLAVVLVFCACASVLHAGDPTETCYDPQGDPSYGVFTSDAGYYHIIGLDSYSSSDYNLLCAVRAKYANGPNGLVNTYGPWHGNNKEDLTDCNTFLESDFTNTGDWTQAGYGSFATRTDSATGKLIVVQIQMGAACSQEILCAGICPASPNYAANIAAATVHNFSRPTGNTPAGVYVVYTTFNTTSLVDTAVSSPGYDTKNLSVISSVQLCAGRINLTCPSS